MTLAATFLGGASGRLLPAAVPFRFFGAAAAYQVAAWGVLVATWGGWIDFAGGLGLPLAALHLLTLGVLAMAALGAGAQLMPVATRQPPVSGRWLDFIWWVYTPGVAVLTAGMATGSATALLLGSAAVAGPLAAWALLMARHLARARGMPGVRAHAWGSLACLALVLVTGTALTAWWSGAAQPPRPLLTHAHQVVAPFGFMGLLSAGLSYILVPMFVLSPAPAERRQLGALAFFAAALLLACASGHLGGPLLAAAAVAGAAGAAWHLWLMRAAIASGMRKDLGHSFLLVRFGWGALGVAVAIALAIGFGAEVEARWLVAAALCWLSSVLAGFLQRILPFLGSMHAAAGRRRGPTASSLSHAGLLRAHALCHVAAWCAVAAALATHSRALAALAAVAGLAGSMAFALFFAQLLRRMRAACVPQS
ncbi:hypothetical protein GCM10027034_29070 [Ramlibacter solisilvae]|uniref:Uncharacterized protein n=1 Tax=Ramlibacter tataouinensis TaxID=94132 RepID=A0A127JWU9_9BURK|nr:hypothetical protein [Ramlibacter tataouinensis]AMO22512.1 hypothetical protein UC35_05940 [Ramlibacter tataouinensis]